MLSLAEISLFITEEVYLIKNDTSRTNIAKAEPEEDKEEEMPTVSIEPVQQKTEVAAFKPVLFVLEKELVGLAEETFRKLVSNGLSLTEKEYSLITQEQVTFDQPEAISSTKIVLFGVPFSVYQIKYKLYSTGKQLILFSDPMEKVAENVDLKRQLWSQLQLMFPKKDT